MKERLLGNKEKFAIQYEVTGAINQFLYGKMCYWVQGRQLGEYEEILLSDCLIFLPTIVRDSGNRMHENFFIMDMKEVFHLLSGAALPDSYKEYLKQYGGGYFGFIIVYSCDCNGMFYIKNKVAKELALENAFLPIIDLETGISLDLKY